MIFFLAHSYSTTKLGIHGDDGGGGDDDDDDRFILYGSISHPFIGKVTPKR